MPVQQVQVDVAILGGGIVGLWTLARLRSLGYSAVILEPNSLGAGQTLASQGIIHGGIKYALTGAASKASRAIAEMPAIWDACLTSNRLVDLQSARVLSNDQILWTTGGIGSRLMGVAASRAIRTAVERVDPEKRPPLFAKAPRSVHLYRVEESVLDVRSVVEALVHAAGDANPAIPCGVDGEGAGPVVRAHGNAIDRISGFFSGDDPRAGAGEIEVRAAKYVLAAGAGNETILRRCGLSTDQPNRFHARMQRRPLHMVMLREVNPHNDREIPALFGHCIGLSDKPRLTVTTARDAAGRRVWYLGGQLAEQGVSRERHDQIDAAKAAVRECLPWYPWDRGMLEWAAFRIDRAEGLTEDGDRPDEPVVVRVENMLVAWPTKLAFAPATAEWIKKLLQEDNITPGCAASPADAAAALANLPRAPIGNPPWDDTSGSVIWTP